MAKRKGLRSQSIPRKRQKTIPITPEDSTPLDLINNLNDDCLGRVFKYLPVPDRLGIDAVCTRWRDASHLAWESTRSLNLSPNPQKLDPHPIPKPLITNLITRRLLKKCGHYLKSLKLAHPITFEVLPLVEKHCDNLTRLEVDFHGEKSTQKSLKSFPRLSKLQHYSMGAVQFFPREALQVLPPETLTEIHLWTYNSGTLGRGLGSLPRIASNAFESMKKLTAVSLHGFDLKSDILSVISQKQNLRFLSLKCSRLKSGLNCLFNLTNLETLDVTAVDGVNDRFLNDLTENCGKLRTLNLNLACEISDLGISSLRRIKGLEQLSLSHVDSITDGALGGLNSLKRLDCVHCEKVKDEGILRLMRNAGGLEHLNLVFSGVTKRVVEEAHEIAKERREFSMVLVVQNHGRGDGRDYPCLAITFLGRSHSFVEFALNH